MKVYVEPPKNVSQAMFRVARALTRFAPKHIEITLNVEEADLQVLHVIGGDVFDFKSKAKEIATIQYCMTTATGSPKEWMNFWKQNRVVWSYYDLTQIIPSKVKFYYAPLGVDEQFAFDFTDTVRSYGAFTSGYVNGHDSEAIEEVALAADAFGLSTVHLGPIPVGLKNPVPKSWRNFQSIDDIQLADIYRHTHWVSGLRHVEGFELPVIEGLACGARPIVFDRSEMRHWYNGHAMFVPECNGSDLVDSLLKVFAKKPEPVTELERWSVRQRFNWETIVKGFWSQVNA